MSEGLPTLDPTAVVRRRPHVLSRELEGEAVLLDPVAGEYFSVNPVGAAIWATLAEPRSLASLQGAVLERFAVGADQAWTDLVTFVAELERRGLVEIVAV